MRYCIECGHATNQKADNLFVCNNGHENWLNAAPCAGAIVIKDGKVLFGKRVIEPRPGGLTVPGGFVDLNETIEEAVLREVKEEAGIDGEIVDYLGSYCTNYDDPMKPILACMYIVKIIGGEVRLADDIAGEPIWRALDDLPTKEELVWEWQTELFEAIGRWYEASPQKL